MKFDRDVCFLDIESTTTGDGGPNPATDRIIDIAIARFVPGPQGGLVHSHTTNWRVDPGVRIAPECTAIHGITDADVAGRQRFAAIAAQVLQLLEGADLGGYNLRNYDVPLLWEELYRADWTWVLEGVRIFDACTIFKKREERTLAAAVKFFLGRDHEEAHGAKADAHASADVLLAQLDRYPDLGAMKPEELAAYITEGEPRRVDLAGKLVRNGDGDVVFNFGKHKGVRVISCPDYAAWMQKQDFPKNTLLAVQLQFDIADAMYDGDYTGI